MSHKTYINRSGLSDIFPFRGFEDSDSLKEVVVRCEWKKVSSIPNLLSNEKRSASREVAVVELEDDVEDMKALIDSKLYIFIAEFNNYILALSEMQLALEKCSVNFSCCQEKVLHETAGQEFDKELPLFTFP